LALFTAIATPAAAAAVAAAAIAILPHPRGFVDDAAVNAAAFTVSSVFLLHSQITCYDVLASFAEAAVLCMSAIVAK